MHSSNLDLFTACDHLPNYLLGSKGSSYKVNETAFQEAVGTTKPRWEWLEQKIIPGMTPNETQGYPGMPGLYTKEHVNGLTNGQAKIEHRAGEAVPRPELEVFGLAMVGGGMVYGAAHPHGKDA